MKGELTKEEDSYLNIWMNKVSRSFAVVVTALEEPLKNYMSAAYILCRVIDNIEDCTSPNAWKIDRFEEVSKLLAEPELALDILSVWDAEIWPGLTNDERHLMTSADGAQLWSIFAQFPAEVKSILSHWTRQMVEGMSHLEQAGYRPRFVNRNGIQVLEDEYDYDHYCYIVAGTVGNLSTELVTQHYQLTASTASMLLENCEACGRGLQKTNIIKDFPEDLLRGISYLPGNWLEEVSNTPLSLSGAPAEWNYKVLENIIGELRDATQYVLALPYTAPGYRMASLLCLLPAYQTILLAAQKQEQLFTSGHPSKISHVTFAQCLFDAKKMVKDNNSILDYSQEIESQMDYYFGENSSRISYSGVGLK